jgi:hypothetical protein
MPSALAYLGALVALAMLTGMVGCSQGSSGVMPNVPQLAADASLPESPAGDGVVLGYFQFVFDENSVRVEEAEPVRGAQFDIGPYVLVILDDFYFNEDERNWYITATIRNISPYTGYDIRAVFHSMGNKFVVNQDGFIWALPPKFPVPTRCAFIAYGKSQPKRAYPPMYQDTRTVIIHQPEGVPKLAPIGFWIDGQGKNRKEPMVEDLVVTPIDDTNYHLTGFIFDHQSPSKDLVVFADCTKFNGVPYVPMFDDGAHGDGAAKDKIWGCDFSGDPEDGWYMITVYAFDPDQNQGENDAGFQHGEPCDEPLEPWPFETIDKGEYSGITELSEIVINGQDQWMGVWQEHTSNIYPPPPPPPVDFEKHTVIGVWIGDRPSNNHLATIDSLMFDPCEELLTVHYVYTPYIACGPLDVITDPFHIVILPKFTGEVYFTSDEVDCPPPPPECVEDIPFEPLMNGVYSGIKDPYELKITNNDQFTELWKQHTEGMIPPPPPPEINFQHFDLIAVGLGNRPSSGFVCQIERICLLDNGHIGVFYVERIPGPDCPVLAVITQPYDWVLIQKLEMPVMWFASNEVYPCPPCVPLPWYQLADGYQSCAEPGQYGFQGFTDEFESLWKEIYCGNPETVPPIPDPIQGGEMKPFVIQCHEFETSGYYITIDDVCLDGCDAYVSWTLHIPGQNCVVEPVVTKPWAFGVAEFPPIDCKIVWHFEGHESVYDCPSDCQPVPFWPLANGDQSCAETGEFGWQDTETYHQYWFDIMCWEPGGVDPPPPPTDPDPIEGGIIYHFAIQLGERPTTGYFVTVEEVCIIGCDVYIKYTEHIPGENCEVEQVVTRPWLVCAVELPPVYCYWTWHFERYEDVYDCPDNPCWDFKWVAGGQHSGGEEFQTWFIQTYAEWHAYWVQYHSGQPMPPIDWQGGWGVYVIHLGQRPTTGYEVEVYEICESEDPFGAAVRWIEWIPGPTCNVQPVITSPWVVVTFPLVDLPYFDEGIEKVYECG